MIHDLRAQTVPSLRGLVCTLLLISAIGGLGCTGTTQGTPYAGSALESALPNPWTASGHFGGMSQFNATKLNSIHQGAHWGPIKYVDADVASTKPEEISVNPIDDYTWGAAAQSIRDGHCYIIVGLFDRSNPRYGTTHYGRLPAGAACVGSAATPQNAASTSWPYIG